jgi:hypothetical protein
MLSPAITGKLPATVDEMAIVLARASMSPVIYEVLDFACGICDPHRLNENAYTTGRPKCQKRTATMPNSPWWVRIALEDGASATRSALCRDAINAIRVSLASK